MGKLKWYKRDPIAALEGMAELSNEECGAYNRVLDLIYARDGNLRDDDYFIAGWCRCDVRVWRRIKIRLVSLNKIYILDGLVRNGRADVEVLRGLSMVASVTEQNRIKGIKSGIIRRKNKTLYEQTHEPAANTTTTTTRKKDKKAESALSLVSANFEELFIKFWTQYPEKVKKPKAKLALQSALKRASFDEIMEGLACYIKTKPHDRSWAHPTSWLNADRWADKPAVGSGSFVRNSWDDPLAGMR